MVNSYFKIQGAVWNQLRVLEICFAISFFHGAFFPGGYY